ncbi:MAG: VOC family protein [Actinobacteria bacterium]|nr:VOC family protein [Actinomycetota bacterium]
MLQLLNITFSCSDPGRLAEFWGTLLDYERAPAGDSWIATDPRGEGTRLLFNRMEKSETIEVPIHLDVNVPDREAELQRILKLGGQLVETTSHSIGELAETWTVMRDPERNGFCIQSPPNTPPHRYIGNVTFSCAEPPQLGAFWAKALGWPEEEIDENFSQQLRKAGVDERELSALYAIRPPNEGRPRFLFQRREKSRPASYPIHLDFRTEDREAEIERLECAGASVVETKKGVNVTFTVLRDPDGNPFCVR